MSTCQDSRFKIEIKKNAEFYCYLIFDKEKIISKGKMILNKNNFTLGKIKGILSSRNLKIQNSDAINPKLLHFTQCDEKYLTFIKIK